MRELSFQISFSLTGFSLTGKSAMLNLNRYCHERTSFSFISIKDDLLISFRFTDLSIFK